MHNDAFERMTQRCKHDNVSFVHYVCNRIGSQTYNWELPIASNLKVVLKMPMLLSLFGFL